MDDMYIKNLIRSDLGLEKVNEAYVTKAKKYNLPTELLSEKTKKAHQELLADYINSLNDASAKLDSSDRDLANSNNSEFRDLKIDEVHNLNAAFLHALYFENIADTRSVITMDSLTFMRLERDFGTFDDWQKDFMACCAASRCGWAVTYLNTYTQKYMNTFIDLHSESVPAGFYPIVVMDVWQHAYYRDYFKDVSLYTKAMMKQLNWRVIEKRIQKADKIVAILRG